MVVRFLVNRTYWPDGLSGPLKLVKGQTANLTPWEASNLVLSRFAEYVKAPDDEKVELEKRYAELGGRPKKGWSHKKLKRMIEQLEA